MAGPSDEGHEVVAPRSDVFLDSDQFTAQIALLTDPTGARHAEKVWLCPGGVSILRRWRSVVSMGHVGRLSDIGTEQSEPYPLVNLDRFGNPSPLQTINLRPVDGLLAF